jgi:hypothetical protein
VNVGSSTTFTAIVSNAGTGGVNYSWKTLSMFNYSLPVLNDNSYLHTPSTITDKFVYVKAHDIQKNADSSYPCVVSVVDPSATVSCEAIDGITLNAGESRNFYTARISKICDPYLRTCPATGGAPQGNPLAKFKNCVEPGVSEF